MSTENMDTAAYWTERDARIDADVADDAQYATSVAGLQHALDVLMSLPSNEQNPARIAALESKLAAARLEANATAAIVDACGSEWTREVTIARRAAWNEAVRALPKGHGPASVIARLGYGPADLKRAINLHNL